MRYDRSVRPPATLALAASLLLPAGRCLAEDGWRAGLRAGVLFPDSRLGAAASFAAEGAWLPAAFAGALALSAELGWSAPRHRTTGTIIGPAGSGPAVTLQDLSLTLALGGRAERVWESLSPYASLGLALHLARVEATSLGSTVAGWQVRPGLAARLGAEWSLGRGGPFLEVGWSRVAVAAGSLGTLEAGGFLAAAGWRLVL